MFKKIIALTVLFAFLAGSIFIPLTKAQTGPSGSWYNPDFNEWNRKVFESPENEIFGERYTYAQVKWIFYSLAALLSGVGSEDIACLTSQDVGNCIKKIISNSENNPVPLADKNLLDSFSRVPVSGVFYIKNRLSELNIIPEVQAQESGFGLTALGDPVLKLWRASRNIAYTFFVIIIVVLAFMIMFRVKINPQTVISLQSALPKIALALIFVTFSYAIAGLMVDFVYVIIGLISTIFIQSDIFANTTDWGTVFGYLTDGPLNSGAFGLFMVYMRAFPTALMLSLGQGIFSGSIGSFLLSGIGVLLIPLILLVTGIVLIVALFKLLLLLFKTFANIILLVIVAPFTITLGAISQTVGFGSWLRAIASNLVVYPIVGIMFTLALLFESGSIFTILNKLGVVGDLAEKFINAGTAIDFNPELLSGSLWSPPLTAGTELTSFLWLGVSLVLVIMTPQVANIIKSIVEGKPFSYGSAIGEALGAPVTLSRGGAAAGFGKWEQGRQVAARRADVPYEKHWTTKTLETTGVIRP